MHLRDVGDQLSPAIESTIAALSPPASDDALVAMMRVLGHDLDRMTPAQRITMLGQTMPHLLRVTEALYKRAAARADAPVDRPPTWLDQQREAIARRDARRRSG